MGVRFLDEPAVKQPRVRFLDEQAPSTLPERIGTGIGTAAKGLPELGFLGGSTLGRMVGGPAGSIAGGAMGAGGGKYYAEQAQEAPFRTLSRLAAPMIGATVPGGAVLGGITPGDVPLGEESMGKVKGAAVAGGIGAGVGELVGAAFRPIWRATGGKSKLIGRVRHAFLQAKQNAGKEFEKGLESIAKKYPKKRVDLSAAVRNLKNIVEGDPTLNIESNPAVLTNIRAGQRKVGNNLLENLINEPDLAKNLTLEQARTLKRTIQSAPQIASNLKKGKLANWDSSHFDLLDFIDDANTNIMSQFPEMANVNKAYADVMSKFNVIKSKLKPGTLGGQITTGLREPEIWKNYVVPLLKKHSPETLREITSLGRTQTAGKLGKWALPVGGIGSALYYGKKLMGRE